MRFGFIALALLLLVWPGARAAEPAPQTVDVALYLKVDSDMIRTKVSVPLPMIRMDLTVEKLALSASADDQALGRFLAALRDQNAGELVQACASAQPIDDPGKFLTFVRPIFFTGGHPPGMVAKVPLESGAAYLLSREDAHASPLFLVDVARDASGTFKVQGASPWAFLDLLNVSLRGFKAPTLFQGARPADPGSRLGEREVNSLFIRQADPSLVPAIRRSLHSLEASGGQDCFTGITSAYAHQILDELPSQQTFDKMTATEKASTIKGLAEEGRNPKYVLNFDPVYIAVQKDPKNFPVIYYFRSSSGKLLIANLNSKGSFDDLVPELPPPSPALLDKFK
jgi:hypothetical protein